MKKDIYSIITILAMVAMPAAAAINFGDAAYDALLINTHRWLAMAGGLATGIGFEAIGILAGHNAIKFYSQKDNRWIIAALALIAYVIVGSYELQAIAFARFVPFLSGLVYIMAGLEYQSKSETEQNNDEKEHQKIIDSQEREFNQKLKIKEVELNAQVKIERAKAKALAPVSQKSSQELSHKSSSAATKHYECVCGRVFDGSRSYNAHRRHCEIPANEPAKIYENGDGLGGK